MKKLTLPALIIQSQHAAAIVQGVPLKDGSKAFKTVECRGPRGHTTYRGGFAVFASRAYNHETEDHYTWYMAWCEAKRKASGGLKIAPADDLRYRAWSRYTFAWSYRLVGFAMLEDSLQSKHMRSEAEITKLHKAATDFRLNWTGYDFDDLPATYLKVRSLYETPAADGPRFDEACYGCTVQQPPHNPTACHVNWQSISLSEQYIPTHVQKELKPWQPK